MSKKGRLERGAYRSVVVAIVDGANFRELDPAHRWLLICLKFVLGPCQIGVIDALEHVMSEKTGLSVRVVRAGLVIIEGAGWIKRERNVVWIVDGLRFEPNYDPSDWKHRTAVRQFIASLPRLGIVAEFKAHYAPYFSENHNPIIEGPPQGPTNGPSNGVGSIETETETETELTTQQQQRAREDESPPLDRSFPDPRHLRAYQHFRGKHRLPASFDADLAAMENGMHPRVRSAVPWSVLGEALHEMAQKNADYSVRYFAGFVRNLAAAPDPSAAFEAKVGRQLTVGETNYLRALKALGARTPQPQSA